jgi:hypothetical protein
MNRKTKMTKADDVRETPSALFRARNDLHSFTLDACATHENALRDRYYTQHDGLCVRVDDGRWACIDPSVDGLSGPWSGRVYCNPPFSELWIWIAAAWGQCAASNPDLIDLLCPATRTEQHGWARLVEPYRDGRAVLVPGWRLTTTFIEGRQHFLKDGQPILEDKPRYSKRNGELLPPRRSSPKFGCVMLTWTKD